LDEEDFLFHKQYAYAIIQVYVLLFYLQTHCGHPLTWGEKGEKDLTMEIDKFYPEIYYKTWTCALLCYVNQLTTHVYFKLNSFFYYEIK